MRPSLAYLARRLLWALVLVAGVTTLSFAVAELLPGDPARMILGPQASPADVARARELYGLDRPVAARYALYWKRLFHRAPSLTPGARGVDPAHRSCASLAFGLHVDLGYSFHYRRPVTELLAARAPRSVELALTAVLVALALGVTLGLASAAKRGTAWDDAAMGLSAVGTSAPTFLLGLVLQYLLAYKLGWLPYDGYGATPGEHLRSLVLPALTLGLFASAMYARLARDELGAVLDADFIRTARAKGASEARVFFVHGLRNALVPLATLATLDAGVLMGGSMVTERLFRWPGVGQMAIDAVLNRDGPVIFGTVLFASSCVVVATFALDALYLLLDPRLRQAPRG